jgi:hypothetical protein
VLTVNIRLMKYGPINDGVWNEGRSKISLIVRCVPKVSGLSR